MKTRKNILLLVALACVGSMYAQKVRVVRSSRQGEMISVDKSKYRVTYAGKMVKDTLNTPYRYIESEMRLDIGEHLTRFYDRTKEIRDSIIHDGVLKGNYDFKNMPKTGGIQWEYYRNYPAQGQSTFLETVLINNFQCIEKVDIPDWQIVPDSSATIMGYGCHLAVTRFKGRTWYAWYAEDLPLSEGPWKLCGLPGLILRAYDAQRQYVFDGIGLTNTNGTADVVFDKMERESISQQDLREAHEKLDYTSLLEGVGTTATIRVKSSDGTVSSDEKEIKRQLKDLNRMMKNNPIELCQ